MTNKQCDICGKDIDVKTYNVNLNNDNIDLYGKIDLCKYCSNNIKVAISKLDIEKDNEITEGE